MARINRIAKKTIKRTDFQLEQDLWNSYRELHRAKGIDVNKFLADWAGQQAERLDSLGVKTISMRFVRMVVHSRCWR